MLRCAVPILYLVTALWNMFSTQGDGGQTDPQGCWDGRQLVPSQLGCAAVGTVHLEGSHQLPGSHRATQRALTELGLIPVLNP